MDFRSKLAHLESRCLPVAAPPDAPPASPRREGDEPEAPPISTERTRVLEDLRRKIADLLGKPQTPPRPAAEPDATSLPFVREERPEGVLYRRLERLAPSHHVGRIPVDSAASASASVLALLALDPTLASCSLSRAL